MLFKSRRCHRSVQILAGAALIMSAGSAFAAASLAETGSSLLYPLFNLWVPAYTAKHDGLRINTAATGSGTGIAQATRGIVQMGASDAYLSDAMMKQHPSMLNIPVAISSQMINTNIPEAKGAHLKLSGPVLAAIYSGQIKYWDNKRITAMNSGAHLPHKRIVPIHRADGSGDTFLFTQFLSSSAKQAWKAGYGTTLSWPKVQGAIGATGNAGMVSALTNNPYSIAYIGVSYKAQINKAGLGVAQIRNKAGKFVMPDETTVPAAAAQMVPKTPKSERISLIFAPGEKSYPIINYEYVLVDSRQPNAEIAKELKSFLKWAVSDKGGNDMQYLQQVNFMPLPAKARQLTLDQINRIHS